MAATTKQFNVSGNAITYLNETTEAANDAKRELNDLQKQMQSMDSKSIEFQKAAAKFKSLSVTVAFIVE